MHNSTKVQYPVRQLRNETEEENNREDSYSLDSQLCVILLLVLIVLRLLPQSSDRFVVVDDVVNKDGEDQNIRQYCPD